jgi:SNF family Na+-dependent transporter
MFNSGEIKWMPEGRTYAALLIIGALVFDTIVSFVAILTDKREFLVENANLFYNIFFIFFAIFNYIVFLYNNRWKKVIKSFSNIEKRKNRYGTIIIYSILLIIVIVWLYSMYIWKINE